VGAIAESGPIDRAQFERDVLPAARPVVFRGLAADWPAVRASSEPGGIGTYLKRLGDAPCELIAGPPEIDGRIFYDAGMSGLTFHKEPGSLATLIDRIEAAASLESPPALAVQSLSAREALPGFAAENTIDLVDPAIGPRLWIGNRIVVATHHDVMENVAVVVAGRRRFTLFPPEQTPNLYVGPFEFTPAGTPVSLVDPESPDLDRFPRFADALPHARTAELGPGDAIFIPYMWWHHVRSLDPFSMLANYWWSATPPAQPGLAPIDALVHALLAIKDLPESQREAWRAMFGQMVFDAEAGHIPEARRGIRGTVSEAAKANLRRQLGGLMSR
jgi:mannose-6-phosphate isomerase-like protein (cupin superfamily)